MSNTLRPITTAILIVSILVGVVHADPLTVHKNDYLNGSGLFLDMTLAGYTLDTSHDVQFGFSNGSYVLALTKLPTSPVSFTDGLHLPFNDSKPTHVSFEFSTEQKQIEDANLRIKNRDSDKTIISFRAGNSGFIRVNDNQMVAFYNDTLSTPDHIITTKMDLLIDWDNQQLRIYCNSTFRGTVGFYHSGITSANQLLLYNLNPGTSYWKNIVVCGDVCYGFSGSAWLSTALVSLMTLLLFLIQ